MSIASVAHVYKYKAGGCVAFFSNNNRAAYASVKFGNQRYNLPPWSVNILPDCKNTVFNTARVACPEAWASSWFASTPHRKVLHFDTDVLTAMVLLWPCNHLVLIFQGLSTRRPLKKDIIQMRSPETGWHMVSGPIEMIVTACRLDANVLDHQQHDYSVDIPASAHLRSPSIPSRHIHCNVKCHSSTIVLAARVPNIVSGGNTATLTATYHQPQSIPGAFPEIVDEAKSI
ncbi:D-galactoside/L-rhamnose binding SUEL lectin domain-containing protein [Artemisia annua]|uniref:D-galactoside/L-rhamnose binding SUEL lectin domain-containing protein n=1 Tax=Artemisia annua TaxID=35608 RepID=A0A2U1M777_ARTAN|nr:D-galactoside/L-rhamnose binding SUEL lectin domain-containing protein [Artemisia annua]